MCRREPCRQSLVVSRSPSHLSFESFCSGAVAFSSMKSFRLHPHCSCCHLRHRHFSRRLCTAEGDAPRECHPSCKLLWFCESCWCACNTRRCRRQRHHCRVQHSSSVLRCCLQVSCCLLRILFSAANSETRAPDRFKIGYRSDMLRCTPEVAHGFHPSACCSVIRTQIPLCCKPRRASRTHELLGLQP